MHRDVNPSDLQAALTALDPYQSLLNTEYELASSIGPGVSP